MGQTLENGVYLPSEGERNCYAGLKTNWEILDQKVADVTALQQAVAGALHREIVESLPTTDIDPNTIYMILSGTSATENVYNEFMYVNNAWELIGTSATDLTNYYTKGDVDGLLLLKANASDLTSHTGDATIHVTTADKTKWNNGVTQSYVFRYSSTALVASSTNSNTLLDNIDNLKVGDKVIDSSGVLFSITAIDTANSTFTVGSALIDLALDANVVHTSGNETVGGIKTFSNDTYIKSLNFTNEVPSPSSSSSSILPIIVTITYGDSSPSVQARLNLRVNADGVKSLYPHENNQYSLGLTSRRWSDFFSYHGNFAGQQQGDEYSSNARTNLTLLANRDTAGQSGCVVDTFRENTTQGTGMHILGFGMKENSIRYEGVRFQWLYDSVNSGYVFNLNPNTQGTNKPLTYNLGTSTDKWDTINGLEPSSLYLPSNTGYVDISSYFTNTGNGQTNSYTASANGWIYLNVVATRLIMQIRDSNDNNIYADMRVRSSDGTIYMTIPIGSGNKLLTQWFTSSSVTVTTARFIPCQGNV